MFVCGLRFYCRVVRNGCLSAILAKGDTGKQLKCNFVRTYFWVQLYFLNCCQSCRPVDQLNIEHTLNVHTTMYLTFGHVVIDIYNDFIYIHVIFANVTIFPNTQATIQYIHVYFFLLSPTIAPLRLTRTDCLSG